MKKKLLPFILSCAMVAAMPLAAHADPELPTVPQGTVDSTNGFANIASQGDLNTDGSPEALKTTIFDGSTAQDGNTFGNKRNAQSNMTGYAATYNNEKGSRVDSQADTDPNTKNDGFSDTDGSGAPAPSPRTDLETAIPGFTMTIPMKTLLPFGATAWNIGLLEISGENFLNPDKVGVIITKEDLVKTGLTDPATNNQKIVFDVKASASGNPAMVDSSVVSGYDATKGFLTTDAKILKFYQNGTRGPLFPYTYNMTDADINYNAGKIVPINEGKHIWLTSTDWTGKESGRYQGSVTFTAYIINGQLVENNDATTAPYPKTIGNKTSGTGKEVKSWNEDNTGPIT